MSNIVPLLGLLHWQLTGVITACQSQCVMAEGRTMKVNPQNMSTPRAPKTVLDKALAAIRELRLPSGVGASRQAIAKLLKERWSVGNAVSLRKALQKGVDTGNLVQEKASFKIVGENPRGGSQEELDAALCQACGFGSHSDPQQVNHVREILEAGANANAEAAASCTPACIRPALVFASGDGCTETVQALLEAKSDIEARDGWDYTAVLLASENGHAETLRVLLGQGADIEATERFHNRTAWNRSVHPSVGS